MREGKENKAFHDEDGYAIKYNWNLAFVTETQFDRFRNATYKEEIFSKYQKEPWSHRYKSGLKITLPFRNKK